MGLVCETPTSFKTQKSEKVLPKATVVGEYLISCRYFSGEDVLNVWWKSLLGFGLGNTHKVYAQCRCPDSEGYDYNPSLRNWG